MTHRIRILPATSETAVVLSTLGRQTFTDAFAKDNNEQDFQQYVEQAFQVSAIQQELVDPNTKFFLAYQQEKAVAYLKLRWGKTTARLGDDDAIEIQRIYVHQAEIGQGIGKQLMQTALDYAQANQFTTIWLGVWEHNPSAIAFYKRWGFQTFDSHIFMMGSDPQTDLLMKRSIPPLKIVPALTEDFPNIEKLLRVQQLPTEDVTPQIFFRVIKSTAGQVVGCCGLEIHDSLGLLRSLAVATNFQQQGLGQQLVNDIIAIAKENQISCLYLITTTANTFFKKFGFETVAREDVPLTIQQTREYSHLCPTSATVMQSTYL